MTSSHVPAVKIELGFVRESILHGVVIKVLVDFITPVMTATLGLAFHQALRTCRGGGTGERIDTCEVLAEILELNEEAKKVNLKVGVGHGLFHKYIQAPFNRILVVDPTKSAGRGENDNISRIEGIHGFFITIKTDESSIFRHINLIFMFVDQSIVALVHLTLKNISHGHEFDGSIRG